MDACVQTCDPNANTVITPNSPAEEREIPELKDSSKKRKRV
jgi:hypothetical protein